MANNEKFIANIGFLTMGLCLRRKGLERIVPWEVLGGNIYLHLVNKNLTL